MKEHTSLRFAHVLCYKHQRSVFSFTSPEEDTPQVEISSYLNKSTAVNRQSVYRKQRVPDHCDMFTRSNIKNLQPPADEARPQSSIRSIFNEPEPRASRSNSTLPFYLDIDIIRVMRLFFLLSSDVYCVPKRCEISPIISWLFRLLLCLWCVPGSLIAGGRVDGTNRGGGRREETSTCTQTYTHNNNYWLLW